MQTRKMGKTLSPGLDRGDPTIVTRVSEMRKARYTTGTAARNTSGDLDTI